MATPTRPIPRPGDLLQNTGTATRAVDNIRTFDLSPLAAGLSDVASALSSAAEARAEADRRAERLMAARAEKEFKVGLEQGLRGLDPGDPAYDQRVEEVLAGARDRALAGKTFSPAMMEELGLSLDLLSERARSSAFDDRKRFLDAQAASAFDELTARVRNQIAADPDKASAIVAANKPEMDNLLAALPAHLRTKALKQMQDETVLSLAEGMARRGQHEAALAYLRSPEHGVDPERLVGAERRVLELRNQQRAEWSRAALRQIADLELRIRRGEAGAPEIKEAERRGLFSEHPGSRTHLYVLAEARELQAAKAAAETKSEAKPAEALTFDRPTTEKQHSEKFAELFGGNFTSEDEFVSAALDYAAVYNGLPGEFKRMMRAASSSNNAKDLAAAALLDKRARDRVHGLDTGADERVLVVQDLAEGMGGDYLRAAQFVLDNKLDDKTVNQINTKFTDSLKKSGVDIAKSFSEEFGLEDARGVGVLQNAIRRAYVINGGDVQNAVKLGIKFLKREGWGVSQINGPPVFTRRPAELAMPDLGGALTVEERRKLIRSEVYTKLSEFGLIPSEVDELDPEEPVTPYRLEYLGDEGGRPRYAVQLMTDYGIYTPVMTDKGRPLIWTPPLPEELANDAMAKYIIEVKRETLRRRRQAIKDSGGLGRPAPTVAPQLDPLRGMAVGE